MAPTNFKMVGPSKSDREQNHPMKKTNSGTTSVILPESSKKWDLKETINWQYVVTVFFAFTNFIAFSSQLWVAASTISSSDNDDLWSLVGLACRFYSCFLTYWTLTFHLFVRLYLLHCNGRFEVGDMSENGMARRGALHLLSLTLAVLICE